MPLDRQLFARDIAAALVEFAKQKYRGGGEIARAWKIDKTTAANVLKGHLSVTVLAKAIAAEGGDLWDRLGEEITGETYEQRQERRLSTIIKQAEDARQNLHRLRTRSAQLADRTAELDPTRGRPMAGSPGSGDRGGGSADGRAGVRAAGENRSAQAG